MYVADIPANQINLALTKKPHTYLRSSHKVVIKIA